MPKRGSWTSTLTPVSVCLARLRLLTLKYAKYLVPDDTLLARGWARLGESGSHLLQRPQLPPPSLLPAAAEAPRPLAAESSPSARTPVLSPPGAWLPAGTALNSSAVSPGQGSTAAACPWAASPSAAVILLLLQGSVF